MQKIIASSRSLDDVPKALRARVGAMHERQRLLENRIQRFLQSQFDQTRLGTPISDAERAFEVNTGRMQRWLDRVAGPAFDEALAVLAEADYHAADWDWCGGCRGGRGGGG